MKKIKISAYAVVAFLLILALMYKVFEWNTVKNLQKLYSSSITSELRLIADASGNSKDIITNVTNFYAAASRSAELQDKAYSELKGSVDLSDSLTKDYLKLNTENKKSYEQINSYLKFFMGPNIEKAKRVVSDQLTYYKNEIEKVEDSLIQSNFYKNLFMVLNDNQKISNFNSLPATKESAKNNFYSLSSLSKYTETTFKFDDEEAIKKYGPQEYQILTRYKRYFSTFYELIKMYIKDQESTQNYQNVWNKLQQDMANINIDFDSIFSDKEDISNERSKNIIAAVGDQIKYVYEINNQNTFSYPLLGTIKFNKHQLLQCQLYGVKAGLYYTYKKEYPNLKDVKQFLLDLALIAPKTSEIDKYFDKSILKIEDKTDDYIYSCKDKDANEIYSYTVIK